MSRRRTAVIIGAVVATVTAAGAGVGVGVTAGSGSSSAGVTGSEGHGGSMSSYYDSMMRKYQGGSMMGGPAGGISYGWMMGGTGAPGWMRGGTLPAAMMGPGTDAAGIMGRLFAGAPGPRVSAAEATRLGNDVRRARRLTVRATGLPSRARRITSSCWPALRAGQPRHSGSPAW